MLRSSKASSEVTTQLYGYEDELEIQYLREKTDDNGSFWELATYDYDCRPREDLKKI